MIQIPTKLNAKALNPEFIEEGIYYVVRQGINEFVIDGKRLGQHILAFADRGVANVAAKKGHECYLQQVDEVSLSMLCRRYSFDGYTLVTAEGAICVTLTTHGRTEAN